MTKSNIHDADIYSFSQSDKILLDANIWLYLFPPPSNPGRPEARQYGHIFKKIQTANANIIIDQFVISEYLNRYSRISFSAVKEKYQNNYKKFRKSNDFLSASAIATEFSRKIISFSVHHSNIIDLEIITTAINDFEKAEIDFNDSIFVQLCQRNNYIFLTHDADFYNSPIEIITSNPRLLS